MHEADIETLFDELHSRMKSNSENLRYYNEFLDNYPKLEDKFGVDPLKYKDILRKNFCSFCKQYQFVNSMLEYNFLDEYIQDLQKKIEKDEEKSKNFQNNELLLEDWFKKIYKDKEFIKLQYEIETKRDLLKFFYRIREYIWGIIKLENEYFSHRWDERYPEEFEIENGAIK